MAEAAGTATWQDIKCVCECVRGVLYAVAGVTHSLKRLDNDKVIFRRQLLAAASSCSCMLAAGCLLLACLPTCSWLLAVGCWVLADK